MYALPTHVMLRLAWLGRDSSQHAGAAQIPPPRCRQGLCTPVRPEGLDSIYLTSSFAVWRPSGVVEGLQTPPGTPDGVWRPSGVKSSLQTLRGLKVSVLNHPISQMSLQLIQHSASTLADHLLDPVVIQMRERWPPQPWSNLAPLTRLSPSEATRAQSLPIHQGIAWCALNAVQGKTWHQSGAVYAKGSHNMSPAEAVRSTSRNDAYLHLSLDQLTGYRYAHGQGNGSNILLMLDLSALQEHRSARVIPLVTDADQCRQAYKPIL